MTNATITQLEGSYTTNTELFAAIRARLETVGFVYISETPPNFWLYKELTTGVSAKDLNFRVGLDFGDSTNTQFITGIGQTSSPTNTVLAQDFNDTSNAATDSKVAAGNYNLTTIDHPEVAGCILFANTNVTSVGIFSNTLCFQYLYYRPLTVPSYWNENSAVFAFIPKSLSILPNITDGVSASWEHKFLAASNNQPIGATGDLYLNYGSQIIDANTDNANKRALFTAPSIVNSTSNGVVARFSSDIACVAADGLPIGQQVKKGSGEAYTIIEPEYTTNKKMRMAVRTA